MPVMDAMRMVNGKRFRHLPLVQDGKLVGLVSSGDLNRWVVDEQTAEIDNLSQKMRGLASKNKSLIVLLSGFAVLVVIGVLTS